MSKFRYARSNGEFLPTRFTDRAISGNPQFFTIQQAYNLSVDFISGTSSPQNSLMKDELLAGYKGSTRGAPFVWWRLNKDVSSAGDAADSINGTYPLSPPSAADRPGFSSGDSPNLEYIQTGSCSFSGTQFLEAGSNSAFSFGNGTRDLPFSIACWVKFSAVGSSEYLVSKYNGSTSETEFIFRKPSTDKIVLEFFDDSTGGNVQALTSTTVSAGSWLHLAATYDGRGGAAAGDGIKIYINGSQKATSAIDDADYVAMEDTAANLAVANRDDESGSLAFSGNLADVAMWDRALLSSEIVNLYGVAIGGAYRLVRRFDQISPENDTRLLGSATGRRGFDTTSFPSDMLDGFRQGVNVVTDKQLNGFLGYKIRSNSDFITTLDGKDVSTRYFDDSLTPVIIPGRRLFGTYIHTQSIQATMALTTASAAGPVEEYSAGRFTTTGRLTDLVGGERTGRWIGFKGEFSGGIFVEGGREHGQGVYQAFNMPMDMGSTGRISNRLNHQMENRDLGQKDIYVNLDGYEPYEDTLDLGAPSIITIPNDDDSVYVYTGPIPLLTKHPEDVVLPRNIVMQSSAESMDGAIEPLIIRAAIDRSSIEQPFYAHTIRASLGGMTTPFRRSYIITDGWDLNEPGAGCAPYLDSTEAFSFDQPVTASNANVESYVEQAWQLALKGTTGINLPGPLSTDFGTIAPWNDYLNDVEEEYTTNSVTSTISHMLIVSSSMSGGRLSYFAESIRTYDKMAHAGFVFDNDPIGIDSIAYGGLKK